MEMTWKESMKKFVGLSAVLTGFNDVALEGLFDKDVYDEDEQQTNIIAHYLDEWRKRVQAESKSDNLANIILNKYDALYRQYNDDQKVGEILMDDSDCDSEITCPKKLQQCETVIACQKLIFLWYMGAWPTVVLPKEKTDEEKAAEKEKTEAELKAEKEKETRGMTFSTTLSKQSYSSGLVWQVMQSHPMGNAGAGIFNGGEYGDWAKEPQIALKDLTHPEPTE